jgi:hypothetical protein
MAGARQLSNKNAPQGQKRLPSSQFTPRELPAGAGPDTVRGVDRGDAQAMFKFIHAEDIHLDGPLTGLRQYEGAPVESIRNSPGRALANLLALASSERRDAIHTYSRLAPWKAFP